MTYPFVAAAAQYGPRKGPVKAFAIHMAEGGGTVGFLSRPNPRNVSVHYVIERTGRIVQMVRESEASGSINPNDLRTTNDPETFGATVRKAVMGEWDRDPNSAVISVEIEGFAVSGPNATQVASLKTLVNDVRSRYPSMGLLGHRDWQDYKACPGQLIPWTALGGHGPSSEAAPMRPFPVGIDPQLAAIKPGAQLYLLDLAPAIKVSNVPAAPSPYTYRTGDVSYRVVEITTGGVKQLLLARAADCTLTPVPSDCAGKVAAEHERVRLAAIKAVEAI